MEKKLLSIVIPCFNEYNRLPLEEFREFLSARDDVVLCMVDDASTDGTQKRMETLRKEFSDRVVLLRNSKNAGKAASVRKGVLHCYENNYAEATAYLDADLAVSLDECYSYVSYLEEKKLVFASRILRVGSRIERRYSRFLIGRIIATAISNILKLKVYDTQCGCKVFRSDISSILFGAPFQSKWLFDVEIISRFINHYTLQASLELMEEIPVKQWIDRGESKVRITYFFRLWIDLFRIWKKHRAEMPRTS
jgi:glycosyltransferase involved in cell wall biosynthesis